MTDLEQYTEIVNEVTDRVNQIIQPAVSISVANEMIIQRQILNKSKMIQICVAVRRYRVSKSTIQRWIDDKTLDRYHFGSEAYVIEEKLKEVIKNRYNPNMIR